MLLADLARASRAVADTPSRTTKRRLLAEVIAAAGPHEVGLAVAYLAGALPQRRTGLGWASLTALPPPAATATLTLRAVDAALDKIAGITGPGSGARRTAVATELFAAATDAEQPFLRALIFGELHQGALDALVLEALADAFEAPRPDVHRAAMLLGSTPAAAVLLAASGVAGLRTVRLRVGRAVRPMLAAPAADPAAAIAKLGLPVIVDAKLDGIRVQVHRRGQVVRIFTRSLEDVTDRLPEVVATARGLDATDLVLDGEVIGIGTDSRPLPFQTIAARTASSTDVATARLGTPLRLYGFDLLHLDGRDLLDDPLSTRAELLGALLPNQHLVPRRTATREADVRQMFADAIAAGYEGIVVKKPGSAYAAGRRDGAWIKVKPRHTLDLAVTAAEWGHGRRSGLLSNLHLAARDPATGRLVMLGKTFKGLTDAVLSWQTEQILARESRRDRHAVYIDPPLVAEIAFDGVQISPRYPGGVALRFARVLRYREDKTVDEIDSLDAVLALRPAAPGGDAERS